MITKEQAVNLYHGQVLYHGINRNADGTPERWRVNGKCKIWKTRPDEFRLPLKYGLKTCDYMDHTNSHLLFLTEEEAMDDEKNLQEHFRLTHVVKN